MRKITTLFLCIVLVLVASVGVTAVPAPLQPGRVTDDNDINIKDATQIQKYLAGLCDLRKEEEYCADVDNDSQVTIKDATIIQKYVAGVITEFSKEPGYIKVYPDYLYADFDSGTAMAGVPVTFTANAKGYLAPFSYEFLIDDVVVSERSESNTFTYTFEEPGAYFVTLRVYNSFSVMSDITTLYYVSEPFESETPVIKAFYFDKGFIVGPYDDYSMDSFDEDFTLTAEAMFGSGDYEYCFMINDVVVQDFSENNQYLLKEVEDRTTLTITVCVRDSSTGAEHVSKTMTVHCGGIVG